MDATTNGRQHHLLVVDDEGDIADSLKTLIERAMPTVQVHTAPSGPAGLAQLRNHRMELLIADYKMPGMNGIEFLRRAEEVTPGVPRILITAFPDLQVAMRAINEAEIDRFYTKPFQGSEVVEAVDTLLFKHKDRSAWSQSFMDSLAMLKKKSSLDE